MTLFSSNYDFILKMSGDTDMWDIFFIFSQSEPPSINKSSLLSFHSLYQRQWRQKYLRLSVNESVYFVGEGQRSL